MGEDAFKDYPTENLTMRSRILKIPNLKLIEKVGDGGMSTVWKAWDTVNQRIVAVKILNREFATNGGYVIRASCRPTTSTTGTGTGIS